MRARVRQRDAQDLLPAAHSRTTRSMRQSHRQLVERSSTCPPCHPGQTCQNLFKLAQRGGLLRLPRPPEQGMATRHTCTASTQDHSVQYGVPHTLGGGAVGKAVHAIAGWVEDSCLAPRHLVAK